MLKFSQGSVTVYQIMTNYQEVWVKPTNTRLNKLKYAANEKKTLATLRLNKEKFSDEKLSHEFFLIRKQTTKNRNPFANNTSTDKKS